ncbi:MAG: hypothetical protein M3R43_12890, partial [Acidobacteriota bacterium]|nr:hypothetical protein [Acidobacteriota bacterium]
PGDVTFGLSASEAVRTGYTGSGGTIFSTALYGDAALLSKSETHPFSMIFDGGYLFTSSSGQPSSPFLNLSLSQVLTTKNWNFVVSDSVRYLPESPVSGLSGLSGLGNLGIPTGIVNQGPLSLFGQRITNTTTASIDRKLTASTDLQLAGSYDFLRFLGNNTGGFDYNSVSAQAGVSHRINAISSGGGHYSFSQFKYPVGRFSFKSHSINVDYSRHFNRRLFMDASAGPQITSSTSQPSPNLSNPPIHNTTVNYTANVSFDYLFEKASANLTYFRGVRSGAGVFQGTMADTVSAGYNRSIGELTNVTAIASFVDSRNIPGITTNLYSAHTYLLDVQGSRAIGRYLSAHASYSILDQSVTRQAATSIPTAFNGFSQVITIGITYSPRPFHFGH